MLKNSIYAKWMQSKNAFKWNETTEFNSNIDLENKKYNTYNINLYKLETFKRSNQDTCLIQKPAVIEGDWVQSGELLTDCASSVGGELSLGQNLLIGYMPWDGYNFEDAILISERLVIDDLYTSVHIERYEIEPQETKLGKEQITRNLPDVTLKDLDKIDSFGVIKLGSWVEEGDILVGKITPINKKAISPYQKLLYTILEKQILPYRESSLRAPKGIKAKVIDIKYFPYKSKEKKKKRMFTKTKRHSKMFLIQTLAKTNLGPKNLHSQKCPKGLLTDLSVSRPFEGVGHGKKKFDVINKNKQKISPFPAGASFSRLAMTPVQKKVLLTQRQTMVWRVAKKKYIKLQNLNVKNFCIKIPTITRVNSTSGFMLERKHDEKNYNKICSESILLNNKALYIQKYNLKKNKIVKNHNNNLNINIHIYLAEKRKIQVGDKMAGRHGNKGIVSKILPIQDMPYLPDGTPIDIILNPLGVPSRMNVGQIYECLLGLAGKYLGENYKIFAFDELYGPEASRNFVFNKLYEARCKTGNKWLFNPSTPGKIRICDGRNGDYFDQNITVGYAYILRLVHMVDDKIHMRSTGPYSLVTQQPLRGRSKQGGQRLGEMEVWAIEGFGAAFTLLEMLTIKSDDMIGRMTLWSNLILNKQISIGTPESFKVLICELQALCLDIGLFK